MPWRSDRSFCVCAWNRGEGCRIALWDCLWTNLDPVSISTFQQPKEKYYSRCWNPPSPVTQFTLFLSLPPSLTFCGPPPPSFARFCLIHAFLVLECRTRTVRNFYKFLIKQLESFTHHCVLQWDSNLAGEYDVWLKHSLDEETHLNGVTISFTTNWYPLIYSWFRYSTERLTAFKLTPG